MDYKKYIDNLIENELEKAYQVGDTKDYNGRTYYVHGLNAKGQPLWRLKEKKKRGSGNINSGNKVNNSGATKKVDSGNNSTISTTPKVDSSKNVTQIKKRYNLKPDGTPIDLTKIEDDNLSFTRALISNNIKNMNTALSALSRGAKVSRQKLTNDLEKQIGMLGEIEDEIKRREKEKKY